MTTHLSGLVLTATERIHQADEYLNARTGRYEWRCARYDAALAAMGRIGLDDSHTVVDVGSGWGEFGVRLHTVGGSRDRGWATELFMPCRARYIPIDAANDGTDLAEWIPPRRADFFVCLEVLEHLDDPNALVSRMVGHADRAVIVSTPNPVTTDVLGMDSTHKTPINAPWLRACGFEVTEASFYGKRDDSLFGVWNAKG